jgi:hypothetical protein
MRYLSRKLFVFILVIGSSSLVRADFACSGILTDAQQEGFKALFSPAYSPFLTHTGGPVTPENMAKSLSAAEVNRLSAAKPVVSENSTLTASRAALLKGWLNENASASVPGWISTAIGAVVPEAWIGLSADVFLQLVNNAGDTGRLKVANLAGTVSEGGTVAVLEQVAKTAAGKPKFLWTYVYEANLNGKLVNTPLKICSADIVVK